MGDVNKLFVFKSLLMPSNVLPFYLKQTFPAINLIFTEGDRIESRLPFKFFSTLTCTIFFIFREKNQARICCFYSNDDLRSESKG